MMATGIDPLVFRASTPIKKRGEDEDAEHDEWIEKENGIVPIGSQVTPESAGHNEIEKGNECRTERARKLFDD